MTLWLVIPELEAATVLSSVTLSNLAVYML